MYGEFGYGQPSFSKQYVMLDYDNTVSLNPQMFLQIFDLLKRCGFIPKICTARHEDFDNSDIFLWFDEKDVIFCNGEQKKDVLYRHGIKRKEVAFWIDDKPAAIVDKEDLHGLLWYLNS
jgi:hypothetical protein